VSAQPICPHCGQVLNEDIPLALVGSILLKCPICGLNYSFHRDEGEYSGDQEEEYHMSTGLFRRKPLRTPTGSSPTSQIRIWLILCLSCVIPLIFLSILAVIISLTSILD
jgi:hypothetical protein